MILSGMSPEAGYAMNLEWGDSALANFFGTTAAADGADPIDFSFQQLNRAPETIRSHFVTDAQTGYFRNTPQTSTRFGLGTTGAPVGDSAGALGWKVEPSQLPRYVAISLLALAVWIAVKQS